MDQVERARYRKLSVHAEMQELRIMATLIWWSTLVLMIPIYCVILWNTIPPVPSTPDTYPCSRNSIDRIVYARIGKAGSSSLLNWMRRHSRHLTIAFSQNFDGEHILTLEEEKQKIIEIQSKCKPNTLCFYEAHLYYLNFSRHDVKQPEYFTMMRDPGHRYVSQFYYWRTLRGDFGAEMRNLSLTIEDCAGSSRSNVPYGCPIPDYQTLYFCGHGPPCVSPPDEATYLQAKRNLLENFYFVGILERFNETKALLQRIYPHYFLPDENDEGDSTYRFKQLNYTQPQDQIYKKLNQLNFYDTLLYQMSQALFDYHLGSCELRKER